MGQLREISSALWAHLFSQLIASFRVGEIFEAMGNKYGKAHFTHNAGREGQFSNGVCRYTNYSNYPYLFNSKIDTDSEFNPNLKLIYNAPLSNSGRRLNMTKADG